MKGFASIRWRLQIWHGLILVLVLAGFGITAWELVRANELRRIDADLSERRSAILASLRRAREDGPPPRGLPPLRGSTDGEGSRPRDRGEFPPPPPRDFRLGGRDVGLFEGSDRNAYYYALWVRDGTELARSAAAPPGLTRPDPAAATNTIRMIGTRRELFEYTRPGECVLVGLDIAPQMAGLRRFAWPLLLAGGAILALGVAGGGWLLNRALRPIAQISSTATKIAVGDLSQRIPIAETEDELGELAGVLNSTFARLETSFAQQARFTADASHELRTPVTVLLSQIQTTLARERTATEYRDSLEACQRTAQRMRRLMESLLELARFDAGQEPLKRAPLNLAQVAEESLELIQPLAADRGLKLGTDLSTARCEGDASRLGQVITNLLTNAVQYNRSGGEIRVTTGTDQESAMLRVQDTGVGMAPADCERVFERFFRVDAARTTGAGRTGLGLAIVKAIVEAHGGTVSVSSVPGEGTVFTVRLPRR